MFDINNPPAGIVAINDQVQSALSEMPADVKELLVGQYGDEILNRLLPFFSELVRILMPVLSPSAASWLKSNVSETMRQLAMLNLIQHTVIMPHMLKLAEDPSLPREQLELSDDKLEALAQYVLGYEAKFEAAFKQLDDYDL